MGFLLLILVGWAIWTNNRKNGAERMGLAFCAGCSRNVDAQWKFCPVCGHGLQSGGEK
jgi:rRNA maturation endonuclease Nob1